MYKNFSVNNTTGEVLTSVSNTQQEAIDFINACRQDPELISYGVFQVATGTWLDIWFNQ